MNLIHEALKHQYRKREKGRFEALRWLTLGYFEVGLGRKQKSQGVVCHVPLAGDTAAVNSEILRLKPIPKVLVHLPCSLKSPSSVAHAPEFDRVHSDSSFICSFL